MSTPSLLPSYSDVETALSKMSAKFQASQIHGLYCGLICASGDSDLNAWEAILPCEKDDKKSFSLLKQLYTTSLTQLVNFSFEFVLLLPEDKVSLNDRIEALGLWCQGFLIGLERSQVNLDDRESSELSEALKDITEIAQVDFEADFAEEDSEASYIELVEYVRLAILLVFQELNTHTASQPLSNKNLLH